jgi:hypothetical protein
MQRIFKSIQDPVNNPQAVVRRSFFWFPFQRLLLT